MKSYACTTFGENNIIFWETILGMIKSLVDAGVTRDAEGCSSCITLA